jgi:hypothetical protein
MSATNSTDARQELRERLMRSIRVNEATGCWEWTQARRKKPSLPYGCVSIGDRQKVTHRLMYELAVGSIPCGMMVLHRCDNPPCCNPDHLFLGTHQGNMADMVAKGRQATGARSGRHTKPERTARGSRNGRAKLDEEKAERIRVRYAAGGVKLKDLADEYGVSIQTVWKIAKGKRFTGGK